MRLGTMVATSIALGGLTASAAIATSTDAYERPGATQRVSVGSSGAQAAHLPAPVTANDCGSRAGISASGRYVVFVSDADNLVAERPTIPGRCDAYWHDRVTGVTKRVSVASDGTQAVVPPHLRHVAAGSPTVSADGRYVAFSSAAVNFDTKHDSGHFVHDTRTGETRRATPAGMPRRNAMISGNGHFLAFDTLDAKGLWQIYVRELATGRTVLASSSSTGSLGNNHSRAPSISADGRYVAFESRATNLVPGATTQQVCQCAATDVYWRDLKTGRTVRVSVASDGSQASFAGVPSCVIGVPPAVTLPEPLPNLGGGLEVCRSTVESGGMQISSDGRYVSFESTATNLVPNDNNVSEQTLGVDIFVHDVATRRTERISVGSAGEETTTYNSINGGGAISGNGRFGAYYAIDPSKEVSTECQLTQARVPTVVYQLLGLAPCQPIESVVYDRAAGVREVASLSRTGRTPQGGGCSSFDGVVGDKPVTSFPKALSADGRYVAIYSSGQDLVPGDTNNHCDYFVRDRGAALGVGVMSGARATSDIGSNDAAMGLAVGPELTTARVLARPTMKDLFVRWDVDRLDSTATMSGGALFGLRFLSGRNRYEVRAQRVPALATPNGGGASFGLFRQDATTGTYTKVATLKGGYGTVGEAVVTAVPLSALGLTSGGHLSDVTAFTAVGSYQSGAAKVLDALRLSR